MVQIRSFFRNRSRNSPGPSNLNRNRYKSKLKKPTTRRRNQTSISANGISPTRDKTDSLLLHMPTIQPGLKISIKKANYDSESSFSDRERDMHYYQSSNSDTDFSSGTDRIIPRKGSIDESEITSLDQMSDSDIRKTVISNKMERVVIGDKDIGSSPIPICMQTAAVSEIALKRSTAITSRPAEAECTVASKTPHRSALGTPHEGSVKNPVTFPVRSANLTTGVQGFGTRDESPPESQSFDQIQGQRKNAPSIQDETVRLSTVTIRSVSDSCLPQMMETTDVQFLSEVKKNLMQKSSAIKPNWPLDIDSTTQLKSLTDEFGLPLYNSPPSLEQELTSMALYTNNNIEGSPVSTPPISHCNSTAWSDSYNGSDSWEDLRTESQVMNSVHQTIHHELANMQRLQPAPVIKTSSTENGNNIEVKGNESEENVWRTLRDKARASLPHSPSPPHGRTIETQIPMNWPPRHGLHIQTQERVPHKKSSSSSEEEEVVEDTLTTYLQHSVSYLGDSGPRLVDQPSVELIEGTLLARWCKKDNRTWLWKSSRRWRRFQGILMEPNIGQKPPDGRTYAQRWKKDNRSWLWKSSGVGRICITELSN